MGIIESFIPHDMHDRWQYQFLSIFFSKSSPPQVKPRMDHFPADQGAEVPLYKDKGCPWICTLHLPRVDAH